jgi:hypothetical protein
VVVVVDAGLGGVKVWGWDPFGATVFALASAPAAVLNEKIVRFAGRRYVIDVCLSALAQSISVWWT